MNTWYLVVLERHLFWPGFLEKLPVATTISNEIKYEYPWIKVTNNRDRPLPNRAKFDYWRERKIFFFFFMFSIIQIHNDIKIKKSFIVIPSLWYDDINVRTVEVFQNSHLGDTDQKRLLILTNWGSDKRLMLIEDCWSTSSNLLPNYL